MIKHGNTSLPYNQNEEQIEPEMTGAPSEKPKKKYFEIYTDIISALLKNEALTESEIGDVCGYKNKGRDKISNIDRQVKSLATDWYYIERVSKSPSVYRIKRDLDLIRHIYNNEKFLANRSDFSASTWLMQLLIKKHMQEFSGDEEFIEDLKKMVGTSSMMLNFFLRNDAHLHANLEKILGSSIPLVKTPGINMAVLESLTRKCIVYDLFVTCMFLDHDVALMAKDFPEKSLQIFDDMKQKSAQHKLGAVNYILSFTLMQNLARCVDSVQSNKGQIPPFFLEIVKNYDTIIQNTNKDMTNLDSLEMVARNTEELYKKVSKFLDDTSTINRLSGKIIEMGPLSKRFMNNRTKE